MSGNDVRTEVRPAWPLQTHLELGAFPSAAGCARGHVGSLTREWALTGLTETAKLLTSELVTNAIRASERLRIRADLAIVPVVRIWLASDQISLVIHVWDGHEDVPVRRDVGPDDECGRGLMLVESLAKEWGTYRKADGKVVWALIAPDGQEWD